MQHLPRHLIDSFKQAFHSDLGYDITDEQAEEYGRELLDLMLLLVEIKIKV